MIDPFTAPPLLQPGDRVAVVAPSGYVPASPFERGLAILSERYDVHVRPDVAARHLYLAGTDERRARELQEAIDDPVVRAIFCARGGYGATRILDHIDTSLLTTHPRWLVGYSDITALHARWTAAGVQSVHGPNVQGLAWLNDEERHEFFAALEQPTSAIAFHGLQVLREGDATGPLVGGNLALLGAMCGTADFPPLDGAVLLLEDVNEKPYRVDRLLTQLRRAEVFERVAAVALGRFSQSPPAEDGVTMEQVLADRLSDLRCPVVAGLLIGHDGRNVPVRLGARVRVTGSRLIGE
jgi:muramoyltetrapeptide carboxypeptidase